jgi:hypothetical protein
LFAIDVSSGTQLPDKGFRDFLLDTSKRMEVTIAGFGLDMTIFPTALGLVRQRSDINVKILSHLTWPIFSTFSKLAPAKPGGMDSTLLSKFPIEMFAKFLAKETRIQFEHSETFSLGSYRFAGWFNDLKRFAGAQFFHLTHRIYICSGSLTI